jgi:signal peptidase II
MQAARGASLTGGELPSGAPGPTRAPVPLRLVFAVVAVSALVLDQVTKSLAVDRLTGRPDVEVVGSWLTLHLVRNPGAAFSLGTEFTVVLSFVAMAAIGVVLWLSRRLGSLGWAVGLGLLLGGVAGNFGDRMLREPGPFRGHVIDFLRLPNWPVFNLADICINLAAGVIVVQAFRGIRVDGTRERAEPDQGSREDDGEARAGGTVP